MKLCRIITVLLLIVLIFSATSCGSGDSVSPITTVTDTADTAAEQKYVADYLPDKNYGGYTFQVITVLEYPTDVEEMNGDIINDSYFKRNLLIEERYNIVFKETRVAQYMDLTNNFRKSAMSGSDDFDLCRLIDRDAFTMSLGGYIPLVSELPYLDTTQEWYLKYVNDELEIGGVLPFACSDENIQILDGTLCVFFNKKMMSEYHLTSPYELVENGEWTIDKFYEYSKIVISDLNNDYVYSSKTDRVGVIGELDLIVPSLWVGAGVKTVAKVNGLPVFNAKNEKLHEILKSAFDFVQYPGAVSRDFKEYTSSEESRSANRQNFKNDAALFTIAGFGTSLELRDMENDFGIIPLPKYDENQKQYYTRVADGWINLPLACATDLERTSIIMESLAVESKNIVIPAIYENAILLKAIRDTESLEMLETIMDNRVIDLGDTIWYAAIRQGVYMDKCFFASTPNSNFASAEASQIYNIETTINRAVDALLKRKK